MLACPEYSGWQEEALVLDQARKGDPYESSASPTSLYFPGTFSDLCRPYQLRLLDADATAVTYLGSRHGGYHCGANRCGRLDSDGCTDAADGYAILYAIANQDGKYYAVADGDLHFQTQYTYSDRTNCCS